MTLKYLSSCVCMRRMANERLVDVAKQLLEMFLFTGNVPTERSLVGNGHRLHIWLREIHEQLQLFTCNFDVYSAKTNNLLAVMRECLLAHRWTAAFRILVSIVRKPCQYYGRTVLLLLFELCFQLHVQPDRLLVSLDGYGHLTEYFTSIEYFLYSVSCNRDLATCQQALNLSLLSRCRLKRRRQTKSHAKLMRRAYCGLLSYYDYTCCRLSLINNDGVLNSEESDNIQRRMDMCAEDTKSQWEGFATEPGVWDAFIVKYIELLERENNIKKCEEVLRNYLRCCTIRPNGLRLLYLFYVRHGWTDSQHTVSILKEICSLVESDGLALNYYQLLLNSSAMDCTRINILFNLLDYAASRNCCRAWHYLSKDLTRHVLRYSNSNSVLKEAINQCWSVRADWWPQYHFAVISLPDALSSDDEIDLISFKSVAACCLLGIDNHYAQAVLALVSCLPKPRKSVRRLKFILNV